MQRRKFVLSLGALTTLSPFLNGNDSYFLNQPDLPIEWKTLENEKLLATFITDNDRRVKDILARQQLDTEHPFYGGFPDKFEIYHPMYPASYTAYFIPAYLSPSSEYYQSAAIEKALNLSFDFILDRQYEDGTIDLLTTNFHSTPDVAFAVNPLSTALALLKKRMPNQLIDFQKKASQFLIKGGEALIVGGIHTPNHRWVVCRALARLHQLFPNKKYLDRIEAWLAEGIDIDPDGQYTEKSSTVYSPIVNDCFITTARLLNKPELYAPVRKNLDMSLYFVHANGEVVTEASTRQDQFKIDNMRRYYYVYRYMALHDQNPVYAAMANWIEQLIGVEGLSGNLLYFLEKEDLTTSLSGNGKLPTNYVKHFPFSNMVRIRRAEKDATILAGNYTFFSFFNGKAALQAVRFASAFFGKGQFESKSLRIEEGKYILTQELTGPYFQPHLKENIDPDGDWDKMPRSTRPKSEIQNYVATVSITESAGEFDLHFDLSGTDRVPVSIELAFRSGGQLTGVEKDPNAENAYFLKEAYGQYQLEKDVIEFGPGQHAHAWTQLRGAKPKLNGDSVYLTGYTPFNFHLKIR